MTHSAPFRLVRRSNCVVCESSRTELLVDLPFNNDPPRAYVVRFYLGRLDPTRLEDERYRLLKCLDCHMIFQGEVPDEAGIAEMYGNGGFVRSASDEARTLANRIDYAQQIERLLRYFQLPAGEVRVLDFGSGSGHWLAMARAFGCDASGFELDPEASSHATIGALSHQQFHYINLEQVVEHLVDPTRTVRELAAALRPNGLMRISVPNGQDILQRLETGDWSAPKSSVHSLGAIAPLEHLNCFAPNTLELLATRCGLTRFQFPIRVDAHQNARIRHAASSLFHRVRAESSTAQYFRRNS